MLNREVMWSWIKALRSGKYKQCKFELLMGHRHGNPEFCAIGVLAAITDELYIDYKDRGALKNSSSVIQSHALLDKLGISDPRGISLWWDGERQHVSTLNDKGMPFYMIADLLEDQYLNDRSSYSETQTQAGSDGFYPLSPSTAPTLQEVGLSDSTTPTGSDSSEGEREAYATEEEEVECVS